VSRFSAVRRSIPTIFDQLIVPRLTYLDTVFMPGYTSITWDSPNIDDFCSSVNKALEALELVVGRANDLVAYRIESVLEDMLSVSLCESSDEEPILAEDFTRRTEELCEQNAQVVQTKSQNIEEATRELIELLYPDYARIEAYDAAIEDEDQESLAKTPHSNDTRANRVPLTPAKLAAKKKREARLAQQETAEELFNYFNHRNLEAIIKLVRVKTEHFLKVSQK